MAKPDWGDIQKRFLSEHAKTGISPRDWCEAQGLNYSSAKRYIKVTSYGANSQKGTAKKSANSQKRKEPKTIAKADAKPAENPPVVKASHIVRTPDDFGISDQQAKFAEYVVNGESRTEAYRRSGYTGEGAVAWAAASRLLRNVKVSRYVHHLRNERQSRYTAELDDVISQLKAIIDADPNEIGQYRRVNCRYCWGFGHHYQWRDAVEFEEKRLEAVERKKPEPQDSGGYGFDQSMDPNPDCPRCNGEGRGEAFFADTRDIEGDARYLLHGVKLGKFGIEILTADKDSARKELARLILLRETNDRQVQLDIERLALQNEKLRHEIELMKDGDKDNAIVVHNALPIPGR
ncbi:MULTISPECIES: terminase small subunit [Citrobacter]|uniref:terminase small subunit n=1 Tax=Citrobacter TaxID=544 RepID=UPI00227D04D4|nr:MULTISPECIES: terminase small subunit [Citrobacter]MDM3310724.1 terminase small subunit [Citrobacter sp. Cb223]MEB0958101.1 terminase small subunit [Citrobacter braakii]MEB0987905.1 terminase small subunit [Citrobacter braakii]